MLLLLLLLLLLLKSLLSLNLLLLLLLVDGVGRRSPFDSLLAVVRSFLLVALRGGFPIDPFLRKDGLLFGFYDRVAIEPDGIEGLAGTSDFAAISFSPSTAPLANELHHTTFSIRHRSISHLFTSEKDAIEAIAVAIRNANFSVQSSLLPMAFVHRAIKELVLTVSVLSAIAEITEEDVLVAVPHGTQSVPFVIDPFSFVSIAIGPVKCSKAVAE